MLCLLLVLSTVLNAAEGIRVGAFNIQVFGVSKMDKPDVVDVLLRIIPRYDILLIQEIRDASDTAIHELLALVNQETSDPFQMYLSQRLGSTSSQEQYAYFYRPSKASVAATYQWPDPSYTYFERAPYCIRFTRTTGTVRNFGFIGVHVDPDEAPQEIDKLVDVYDDVNARWSQPNIIIGGDLNAGCSYVTSGDWADIRLKTDARFDWVIGDNVDTTVTSTVCPYDRFVLAGSTLQGGWSSATVYNFRTALGISEALALDVSDHYPIDLVVD